jgi:hypothetical protein
MASSGEIFRSRRNRAKRFRPAAWYCLESEVGQNRPGRRDGYQRMWIDDAFRGETVEMRWRATTDIRINAVQLTFSASPVPITEHVWIDNVAVSTQRIGCAMANT